MSEIEVYRITVINTIYIMIKNIIMQHEIESFKMNSI